MASSVSSERPSGEFVQSLARGLAVIRSFDESEPNLTLTDVAHKTGFSRAVVRRFLHTLVQLGYVGTDGKQFHLLPRVLELGYAYLSGLGLPRLAEPHLQALSDLTGESTSVGVLDGHDVVYVARVAPYRIMSAAIGVGTRLPAYATSMGRVLLAFGPHERAHHYLETAPWPALTAHTITDSTGLRAELDRIREQGWALVDQELEEGLRSIAAPLRDVHGQVIAALNISAPVRRGIVELRRELRGRLLDAARAIEADLARTNRGPADKSIVSSPPDPPSPQFP